MNHNQLIEKIIAANSDLCPNFVYQNPLLDRNVTKALSKSFMKILQTSNQNSTTNNNLRLSILENIRKFCTIEAPGHSQADDHFTESLTEFYKAYTSEHSMEVEDTVEKKLDAFLVRKLKNLDINSSTQSMLNPEVLQALMNLNENGVHLDILARDVIHWDARVDKYLKIIKELWHNDTYASSKLTDDICIKMKAHIEKVLLDVCINIFGTRDQNIGEVIKTNPDLIELIKKCAISAQCFQMCCGILNFIFIMTNFDVELQRFIPEFVNHVKADCALESTCALYPFRFSSLILLLDFNINELPEPLKTMYIQPTMNYLHKLHEQSENDLILLLSHFPQWFDIYFSKKNL